MQARKKATADTIVGLMVLLAIILVNVITFIIRDDLFGGTVRVRATFESVPGLEVGAPVLVSGIRGGRVAGISYDRTRERIRPPGDPRGPAQPVVVTMIVKKDIPIYSDARVRLVQQGFVGDKRVEIDPGTPNGQRLDETSDPLRGDPIFDIEKILKGAENVVVNIEATAAAIRQFIEDEPTVLALRDTILNVDRSMGKIYDYLERNEESVAASIEDLREISANMREFSDAARVFVADDGPFGRITGSIEETTADVREQMRGILEHAETTLDTLNATIGRLDERSASLTTSATGFLDTSKEDFHNLSENLQKTSSNLDEIIMSLRRGEGTVGRLLTDPQPFEDLRESIESLRGFLGGRSGLPATSPMTYGLGQSETTE